jgi:hypothetical protein
MWHIQAEGCNLTVKELPDDILRIQCINGNEMTEYFCTVTDKGLLVISLREHRGGTVSYYDGVKAASVLYTDMVWHLLPDFYKNRINLKATSLKRR